LTLDRHRVSPAGDEVPLARAGEPGRSFPAPPERGRNRRHFERQVLLRSLDTRLLPLRLAHGGVHVLPGCGLVRSECQVADDRIVTDERYREHGGGGF